MSTFKMKLLLVSITIALVASDEQCGHRKSSSPLVYGGTAVNAGDYPWLVPLLRKFNDKFFCGSNLISRQHVLSAAHCIIEKGSTQALTTEDFYAYVGRFNLTVEEKHSHKADIKRIIVHPDWSTNDVRYDADISIIMLKRPVQYTDYIQPVCLPGPEESVFNVHGLVVGYGKSELTTIHENTPRKVEISSPTNEACFISDYQFAKFASSRTFCAGERGKTPCQGDSGSGFFIDVRSSHRILGIVSSTTVQECGSNDFVLFTSVPKYADWIQSEINSSDNEELEYVFDEIAENANVLESPKDKKKVTTECNYQDVSSTYTCLIKDLKLPDEEVQLRIQGGQHIPQRTNRDITAVQMVSGNVVHFPDLTDVLKTFPNLNGFAIAYSKLKYIDRAKFNGLRQFWFLLISDNEIETIPPDAFVDFNNMEVIDICRNKLTNLDPNWISTMHKLRVFRARSNKFQYVPADMFQYNPQLEEILFDYNEIQRIDADFSQLKKLTNLRFFGNTCIDMSFCDADSPKCIKSLRQFLLVVSGLCGHFTE